MCRKWLDWACAQCLQRAECKAGRSWKSSIYLYNKGQYHTQTRYWGSEGGLQLWHREVALSSSEMLAWGDSAKLKYLTCSLCSLLQEPSLYTVKAVFILDNDGTRLLSKVRLAHHSGGLTLSRMSYRTADPSQFYVINVVRRIDVCTKFHSS